MNTIQDLQRNEIPIKDKYCLTIDEAAVYSGIGQKKIRELSDMDDCPFVIWVGAKRLIKRKKFEDYVDRQFSI
mgnify:CR=1 FL=1